MRILPPVTKPWRTRIVRRHEPPVGRGRRAHRRYRQCLRWEFGFTCAFCLCHEADLILHGVEGSGETGVEHFVPVSHDEAAVNEYRNCFYACRYCNQEEARLLALFLRRAGEDLERFEAIPYDAKRLCACSDETLCTLPQLLDEQTIEVDLSGTE